jgi:hypothetical protein
VVAPIDPYSVLVRLAAELDRLDAAEDLDPVVRARTVARLCSVALVAYKQAEPLPAVGEREQQELRAWLAELNLLARAAAETRAYRQTQG